ncbi:MAG TPA: UxaA family hydrolase, partial [Gemmataceae bacterium]|nr:UxaA family hydrolase [Gemmataceae bacterium]
MPVFPLGQYAIHLRPQDNVAVARCAIPAGIELAIPGGNLLVPRQIGLGHKIALRDISKGDAIYKYGQVIGFASKSIVAGEHVHVQNVAADAFERDYAYCSACPPAQARAEPRTFEGYDRDDGRCGTRNYIAILSTVNCSASTSKYIAERIRTTNLLQRFPNVDGVV